MHSVLFIGHEATRTGAPLSLLAVMQELTRHGTTCRTVLLRGGPLTSAFEALGETVVIHRRNPSPRYALSSNALVREGWRVMDRVLALAAWSVGTVRLAWLFRGMRAQDIGCAYVNSAVSCNIIKRLKKNGIPAIVHIHELSLGFSQSGHPHDLAQMLVYALRIIVPSAAVHTYLVSVHGVPREKIIIIPEAVHDPAQRISTDATRVRAALGISPDAFVVCMAGVIDWRKGIDLFIALGRMLAPLLPHARFLWIGGGRGERAFRETWQRFYGVEPDLASRFIFTGELADVAETLSVINVFALTSREDPCPLVHIEAAMLRKPVVCFAGTGGAPEWLGAAGIVVPYQDVQAMAQAIVKIAGDPALARSMGEAGRTLMVPRCLPATVAREVMKVIHATQRTSS